MKIKIKHRDHFFYRKFDSWDGVIGYICETMSFKFERELGRLSDKYIVHFGVPEGENATTNIKKKMIKMNNMEEYNVKLLQEN